MFQPNFTVWWGCGGGFAAPAELFSRRANALQTSLNRKAETAGFETCLTQKACGAGATCPTNTLFPAIVGGFAAHDGWKRRLLEGLRPSKPPARVSSYL